MKAVADPLVVRSRLSESLHPSARWRGLYRKADDVLLLPTIRAIIDARLSHDYGCITALVNRAERWRGVAGINAERVLRLLRANGLTPTHTIRRPAAPTMASWWRCARTWSVSL